MPSRKIVDQACTPSQRVLKVRFRADSGLSRRDSATPGLRPFETFAIGSRRATISRELIEKEPPIGLAGSSRRLRLDLCLHQDGAERRAGLPLFFPIASTFAWGAPVHLTIVLTIQAAASSISRDGSEDLCKSSCVTSRESRCTL